MGDYKYRKTRIKICNLVEGERQVKEIDVYGLTNRQGLPEWLDIVVHRNEDKSWSVTDIKTGLAVFKGFNEPTDPYVPLILTRGDALRKISRMLESGRLNEKDYTQAVKLNPKINEGESV